MKDKYFEDDVYWRKQIHKELEYDFGTDNYRKYFAGSGKCLDLCCGICQFSKRLTEYGYDVVSADISDTALNRVLEFNKNVLRVDMRDKLPFQDNSFDLVFANLSIHYFSDEVTKNVMLEIRRILKNGGVLAGSINGLEGYNVIKDTALEIQRHYWFNNDKYVRLFDYDDLMEYLCDFDIALIDKRETLRFKHKKNYWVFIAKK